MAKVLVWVDDKEVLVQDVFPFYQRDPFPGNHTYKLEIFFDDESSLKKFTKSNHLKDFNEINSSSFFLSLNGLWPESKESEPAVFLINSIQKVVINTTFIILEGICSSVVKQ